MGKELIPTQQFKLVNEPLNSTASYLQGWMNLVVAKSPVASPSRQSYL